MRPSLWWSMYPESPGAACPRRLRNNQPDLLPNLIAGFLRQNPRASITVRSGNADTVLDDLAEQRTELALIEGPALFGVVQDSWLSCDLSVQYSIGFHPTCA